jgi:hypothetical protein
MLTTMDAETERHLHTWLGFCRFFYCNARFVYPAKAGPQNNRTIARPGSPLSREDEI